MKQEIQDALMEFEDGTEDEVTEVGQDYEGADIRNMMLLQLDE